MSFPFVLLADISAAAVIAFTIRRFVFFFVQVDGKSMMDTLNHHEILFAQRYSKKRDVKRFDVVVCRFTDQKRLFLKRVIALPGETISMADDVVYINEEPLAEDFARRKCLRKIEPITLGNDEYYLMGDNRPLSRDSRRLGSVKRADILGRTVFVLFPWKMHRRIH